MGKPNFSHRCLLFLFWAGQTVLCAQTGVAQVAVTPPARTAEAEQVIVQGRAEDLLGEATSASEGRVGAEDLAKRPILRRGELLETVPGLVITQHSGDGKANQYFLRGFNLDHGNDFAISVDGMPVNMRTHAHGQGYSDLNFLIPELVQTIDFQKGPFYPQIGDFSSAGAAEFVLFNTLASGIFTYSIGEHFYLRTLLADTIKSGPGELTLAFEYTHYDGPWDNPENSNRFNGFARYFWEGGDDKIRLTFMGYHAKWDSTDQVAQRAIDQGIIDRFGSLDQSDGGYSDRYSLSFDWLRANAAGQTKLNLYTIYYRLNLFSNFTYFLDDPIRGDQFEQVDRRWIFGGALTHSWTDTWFGHAVENTVGVQVRNDYIPDVALIHTRTRDELNTIRRDEVNEFSIGFFARNEFHWTDWLRSRIGLRADVFNFDVTSELSANSGNVWDGIVSPKFTLIFGPWAKTEFYLDAGYGFHSNDARGATETVDPVTGDRVGSSPPLVRSQGAEIGIRTSALEGLVSTLSFWYLDLDSELVFAGDSGANEPSSESRRYGVEFANFYKPNSWLTFDADVALTHARLIDNPDGDRIPNSIAVVVTSGVTVDTPSGFFGALRLRYFGPQPLIEDNSARGEDSLLFDGRVGYRYKKWEASLDCLNLFDAKVNDIQYFYTSRLRGEPPEGVDDFHIHPAEPREFRFNVTYRF